MSRLLIGLPGLKGKLTNYASRYDMVEVTAGDPRLPTTVKLQGWRERVPAGFAFSVVLPPAVAQLKGDDSQALSESLEVARVLKASCVVLATTAQVRPTKKNRDRIKAIADTIGPDRGHTLVWHGEGMWEPDDYMETAYTAGWLPVFDAAQQPLPPGPIVYTRIRAIGHALQIGHGRIQRAAHALAGRREAYVVIDAAIAGRVAGGLKKALADLPERRAIPQLFKPGGDIVTLDEEQ